MNTKIREKMQVPRKVSGGQSYKTSLIIPVFCGTILPSGDLP